MTMIDYRRNWSIFIFIRGLNEIATCRVLSFNGFFEGLELNGHFFGCQIIFPAFIISTNKIQGLFIFSNDKKISKSWQNYFKNYICTFQWKWILKRWCPYSWWEFWRDFYGFYEWVTSTLVLNRPKLISTDDEYKNTSRWNSNFVPEKCDVFEFQTFFGQYFPANISAKSFAQRQLAQKFNKRSIFDG